MSELGNPKILAGELCREGPGLGLGRPRQPPGPMTSKQTGTAMWRRSPRVRQNAREREGKGQRQSFIYTGFVGLRWMGRARHVLDVMGVRDEAAAPTERMSQPCDGEEPSTRRLLHALLLCWRTFGLLPPSHHANITPSESRQTQKPAPGTIPLTRAEYTQLQKQKAGKGLQRLNGERFLPGAVETLWNQLQMVVYNVVDALQCHCYSDVSFSVMWISPQLFFLNEPARALASVAQWVQALSRAPKGRGFDPQSGHVQGATNLSFSLSLSPSLSLSLKSIKTYHWVRIKKKLCC